MAIASPARLRRNKFGIHIIGLRFKRTDSIFWGIRVSDETLLGQDGDVAIWQIDVILRVASLSDRGHQGSYVGIHCVSMEFSLRQVTLGDEEFKVRSRTF